MKMAPAHTIYGCESCGVSFREIAGLESPIWCADCSATILGGLVPRVDPADAAIEVTPCGNFLGVRHKGEVAGIIRPAIGEAQGRWLANCGAHQWALTSLNNAIAVLCALALYREAHS